MRVTDEPPIKPGYYHVFHKGRRKNARAIHEVVEVQKRYGWDIYVFGDEQPYTWAYLQIQLGTLYRSVEPIEVPTGCPNCIRPVDVVADGRWTRRYCEECGEV
jgi:hypothetical protein